MKLFVVSDPVRSLKSPQWWSNFSHSVWKNVPDYKDDYHAARDAELAKQGGRIIKSAAGKVMVSFDSDKAAIFFILKWS